MVINMNVARALQAVSYIVLESNDSTDDEKKQAKVILDEMDRLAVDEDSSLHLVCHEGISHLGKSMYYLKLVATNEIKDMESIPFWDIICNEIDQKALAFAHNATRENGEERNLFSLWRHDHGLSISCLINYPNLFLNGMNSLKQQLPKSKPWRAYATDLLLAHVSKATPLGIIYRILVQNIKENMKWDEDKVLNTITVNQQMRTLSFLSEDDERLLPARKPALFHFYHNLAFYRRLLECKTDLETKEILRPKTIITMEFNRTRSIQNELLQKEIRFVDLPDGDSQLPPIK